MKYMYDERLRVAYEKSDEVLKSITYDPDKMINTSAVLKYFMSHYCNNIDILKTSFKALNADHPYGAMMLTEVADGKTDKPSKVTIVLNSDNDAVFQRFSLLHELGHLITFDESEEIDSDNYIISTHINYNVMSISPEQYNQSDYLLKEQIANIFALRVLMPSSQFYKKMEEFNDISEVANFFGLTNDAVISRMMIGA